MSSFYGGKQGRTYHIVQRYDSVEQMVNAFSGGGAYTDANYGQYVIIDTIMNLNRKSDPENGLLYRRGFDYNDSASNHPKPSQQDYLDVNNNLKKDEWQAAWAAWVRNPGAGAIYVGQIVGPQGDSPELVPVQWDEIKDTAGVKTVIPISNTRGNDTTVITTPSGTVYNGDTIKTASLTQKEAGNITGAKVAFDIPTLVTEVDVNKNSFFEHDILTYEGQVEEDSVSQGRPFYYKWNFSIPQVTDFVKEEGSQISGYTKDAEGNDIVSGDEYITYKVHNAGAAGAISQHLGRWPYRVVDHIEEVEGSRETFENWASGITVEKGIIYPLADIPNSDDMYVAICITPGTTEVEPEFGDASTYAQNIGKVFQSGDTEWLVTTIPQTAPAHVNKVIYKAGEPSTFETHEVDYIFMDGTGKMFVVYAGSNTAHFLAQLYTIRNIQTTNDGQVVINYINSSKTPDRFPVAQGLKVEYNDNQSYFTIDYWLDGTHEGVIPGTNEPQRHYLKQITEISLDHQNDITQQQKFVATYKGITEGTTHRVIEDISTPVNQILAFDRFETDNMYILYSDPIVRANLPEEKVRVENWTDPTTNPPITYSNLRWYNLGSLGAQYHVQGTYTLNDLKTTLIHGFDNIPGLEDRAGWLVTVIETKQEGGSTVTIPHIYAFDYNDDIDNPSHTLYDNTPSCWYQIMSLSESIMDPQRIVQIAERQTDLEGGDTLQEGMLWFVASRGHDNY